MFEIKKIPNGHKRGWSVTIDGKEAKVEKIEISSKYGKFSYGLRPEGYDGWAFRETGGGGVVTIPYCYTPIGSLYVGLVKENRPNMGEESVWCAIGGFVNPGESHNESQIRETEHESGLNSARATKLEFAGINSNRAFFVTDTIKNEGVCVYALEIPFEWLVVAGGIWILKKNIPTVDYSKSADIGFFHWRDALKFCSDALALSAIGKVVAYLPYN